MGGALLDAHVAKELRGALGGHLAVDAADELGHHDVLERREFRQQMVELVDEADLHAPDCGPIVIAELAGFPADDVDLAGIRPLEQAGDVEKRRFAGARRRHQRHRLSRPQREFGAVEDGQRRFALRVLAFYLVEIDDRYIFRPLLRHRSLTRTGALRRDRDARHATTDTAWRGRTASAP